jgi:16S rRNA processing protein RimM
MSGRDEAWVEIGRVARPHGVRGELSVKLFNAASEALGEGVAVRVRAAGGADRQAQVLGARPAVDGIVLLRLAGVEDRDAADALRGAVLCVPRASLPEPDEGEFYVCDLLGASVLLDDGTALGEVAAVQSAPTVDVVVVEGAGKRWEVPLVADFVVRLDVAGRLLVLRDVEGFELL